MYKMERNVPPKVVLVDKPENVVPSMIIALQSVSGLSYSKLPVEVF